MVKDTSSDATNFCSSVDDLNSTPQEKQTSKPDGKNVVLHDENWLYGTLGDDWNEATSNGFPAWSPLGHSSKFL